MSQIDTEENYLSEALAEQGAINNNLKLVPVAESIRYRKRAQSAEKENELLAEQLSEANLRNSEIVKELNDTQAEQKLTRKLVAAGVVDLEAALLVAKTRIEGNDKADLDTCVQQLKKEKRYLFGDERAVSFTAPRTSGAKERTSAGHTALGRAAKKAAVTGNRTDLQEYLKLRRNFL